MDSVDDEIITVMGMVRLIAESCGPYSDEFNFVDKACSLVFNPIRYRLTSKEQELLNALTKSFYEYREFDPHKIVVDPQWHKIQAMAKDVLREFNCDPDTPGNLIWRLLDIIAVMADLNWQKEAWLEGKLVDFIHARSLLEHFTSTYNVKNILEHFQEYGLTPEQQKSLLKLYNHVMILDSQLEKYWDTFNVAHAITSKEIYNLPEWPFVQKSAEEVLKAFKYVSK